MTEVTIAGARGAIPAYVATPEADGPWPGVLVIHDALGMTTDVRNQADWLASAGYLAVAPDLYYWGGRIRCLFSTMRQAMRGSGAVFEDFEAVRAWLAGREDCSGRVGVIGFCMGGGFAVLLSARDGYGASSVNYGGLPKDAGTLLEQACPIVASYGQRDPTLRGTGPELERLLASSGVAHDVRVYPTAGHGFMNDHASEDVPLGSTGLEGLADRVRRGGDGRCAGADRGVLRRTPAGVSAAQPRVGYG